MSKINRDVDYMSLEKMKYINLLDFLMLIITHEGVESTMDSHEI